MELIYDYNLDKIIVVKSSEVLISRSYQSHSNNLKLVLSDDNSMWAVEWFQLQFGREPKKDYSKIIHFEKSGMTAYGCVLKSYSPDVINNCCNLEIVSDFTLVDTKIKPYYRDYKIDSIIN